MRILPRSVRLTLAVVAFHIIYSRKFICDRFPCKSGLECEDWSVPGRAAVPALKETTKMSQGTVKWFNTQKGYGFINPDEDGADVFVHITAVQNSGLTGLNEGQRVSFELAEQRNGKVAAVNLTVID